MPTIALIKSHLRETRRNFIFNALRQRIREFFVYTVHTAWHFINSSRLRFPLERLHSTFHFNSLTVMKPA